MQIGKFSKTAIALVALSTCLGLFTFSRADAADIIKTNVKGLIIKYIECESVLRRINFHLVNRTNQYQKGILIVRGIDGDGDPLVQARTKFGIRPVSGQKREMQLECHRIQKYLFSVDG